MLDLEDEARARAIGDTDPAVQSGICTFDSRAEAFEAAGLAG